jgi:hypothetical protein
MSPFDPERTFLGHRLDWKRRVADHFTAPSFSGAANTGLRKRLWLAVQVARRIKGRDVITVKHERIISRYVFFDT